MNNQNNLNLNKIYLLIFLLFAVDYYILKDLVPSCLLLSIEHYHKEHHQLPMLLLLINVLRTLAFSAPQVEAQIQSVICNTL